MLTANIQTYLPKILPAITALRRELHGMPEKALCEDRTRQCLYDFLKMQTALRVEMQGPVLYAVWDAPHSVTDTDMPCLAFRADFDAVEGADGTLGHYCGHDGHAASLAGLAMLISAMKPRCKIVLIFQPAEETGEGARLCLPILEKEGVTEIFGWHNIPGLPKGSVDLLPDTFACGSTGMSITVTGTPAHAAYPENGKNPAAVIASLVLFGEKLLQEPHEGMVLITVIGISVGSEAYGVSASKGELRLTLRAEKGRELDSIIEKMTFEAKRLAAAAGMAVEIAFHEPFPATENHTASLEKMRQAVEEAHLTPVTPPEPFRWSEDFGHYLNEVPGAMIGVGSGCDYPALHTADYAFRDDLLEDVLKIMGGLCMRAY
ncbi:MAG: amidohydrolase [Lachnospiraceae bacterium]|nr:amidohydrolase [Lachnospiraceae bacterium]